MSVDDSVCLHIREICPKDFYLAQILRNNESGLAPLMFRLLLNPESLDLLTISQTRKIFTWASDQLINEKIMSIENWLEISFHLCKQRWDSSVDWLENQPMSKITAMIDVVEKFAQKQEDEMKKSSRR